MDEKPVPTGARQRTFGPPAGQVTLIFSDEMPLRFGPRHCGQSSAKELPIGSAAASNAGSQLFISKVWRSPIGSQWNANRTEATEPREAYGVRPACWRFRRPLANGKREQAARTPYATRH